MARTSKTKTKSESNAEATQPKTIWQIGEPQGGTVTDGKREFIQKGTWTEEFNYDVDQDPNPLQRPQMPGLLTRANLNRKLRRAATSKLNIHFRLKRNYKEGEVTLFYDRYGAEEDSLFLDGKLLTKIPGTGESKLQKSEIPLGAVSSGKHILSITTSGGDGIHAIDYLKLQATVTETEQKVENHLRATGLEDYGFWWKEMAKHDGEDDPANRKPFRRGRIWA